MRCVPEAGHESEDPDPESPDEIVTPKASSISAKQRPSNWRWRSIPIPARQGAVLPEIPDEQAAHPFDALGALRRRH